MSAMPTGSTVGTRPSDRGYYTDSAFGCTIVATDPSDRPDLWERFLDGARRSYIHHDVFSALDYDVIRDGSTTSLFFCAIDPAGRMLAGARLQGPYSDARQTHADSEWRSHPDGRTRLRRMVNDRLSEGVVELKTGWVDGAAPRTSKLADMIGYAGPLGCLLLDARYALVTAADHVLSMWQDAGAVVALDVEPASYPDDRYRTRALWWDTRSFRDVAAPDHVRRMDNASRQLVRTRAVSERPHLAPSGATS